MKGYAGAPVLPVAVLRARIEAELGRVSLRRAAREIGLSPNALRNFVAGAEPRIGTRVSLERWLATRPAAAGTTVEDFLRLMGQVTRGLPVRDAKVLGREVSRLLVDTYERRKLPPPRWVRELTHHYRIESG
ncbi:MAG: hypothetical protein HYW06_12135 [Gemmatimonadetes bacterium]|nr:hypothetical protein [Gemmatimonadota bacterium]